MYIEKIDKLFDNNCYTKHYNYKNQKISYINKENTSKKYNIFLTNNKKI